MLHWAGVAESGQRRGIEGPVKAEITEEKFYQESIIDFDRYKEEFKEWIFERNDEETARRYYKYCDELLGGKKINHPSELANIIEGLSKNRKAAIRAFLRFLIEKGYRTKSQLIDFQAVIKIPKSGIRPSSEAFTTTDKIIEALRTVKSDKKKLMIRLLAYTGLRLSEAVDLLKNLNPKELTIKGKIAKYDLLAMYKRIGSKKAKFEATKRAWIAYMPAEFAKQLKRMDVTETMFKGDKLANGIIHANQLRKWHADFLDEHGVPEDVIEFLQGKTPEKILRKHYKDLEKKADKYYEKIEFPF
mgnify:CR=1 FL=1